MFIGDRLCHRPLGAEECNIRCSDAFVIVCFLARRPDLDDLSCMFETWVTFGGCCELLVSFSLPRVASMHKGAVGQSHSGGGTYVKARVLGRGSDRGPAGGNREIVSQNADLIGI